MIIDKTSNKHFENAPFDRAEIVPTIHDYIRNPEDGSFLAYVRVTPELAQKWLDDCNLRNRTMSKQTVAKYGADLASDRWIFTADPIQFDRDGVLLNGQTRAAAVAESGITKLFVVAWNLSPEAQAHMDMGRRRSMSDIITLADPTISYKADRAAAAAYVILYRQNNPATALLSQQTSIVTASEITAYVAEDLRRTDYAARMKKLLGSSDLRWSSNGIAYAAICAVAQLAADRYGSDDTRVIEFFEKQLADGRGLEDKMPAAALRKRLQLGSSRGRVGSRQQEERSNTFWLTAKAFARHLEGKSVSSLQIPNGGFTPSNTKDIRKVL